MESGHHERVCDVLMRVVEQDEESVLAWLWLSGVVDSLDDLCSADSLPQRTGPVALRWFLVRNKNV